MKVHAKSDRYRIKRVDLFAFGISYNDPQHGGTPLYNGNISETEWRTENTDNTLKWYRYGYDAMNRITAATDNTGNYDVSNITYDKVGNIQSLTRNGWQNGSNFTNMDVLDYNYDSGNKLLKVADTGNDLYGFRDDAVNTTDTDDDYSYDQNGNMKTDSNKGITNIEYNHLNLPTKVTVNGGGNNGTIDYVYDAAGIKLKKIVSTGTVTEYSGNYVYSGNTTATSLQFFDHAEGYVNASGSGFDYVYQYKDHLGNIRLSYLEDDNGELQIVEENNYYPFGLKHKGYNGSTSSLGNDVAQKWKFGGKEYDDSFDINTYDFGARNYDPALGRWMNLDPLAEQMRRHSPYNYAFDNPIFFIDPDGMMPCPTGDCDTPASSRAISNDKVQSKLVEFKKNASNIFDLDLDIEGKLMVGGNFEATLGPIGVEAEVAVGKVSGNLDIDDKTAKVSFDGIKVSGESKVRDVTVASVEGKFASGSLEATMNDDGGIDTRAEGKIVDGDISGPSAEAGKDPSVTASVGLDDLKIGGKMKLFGAAKLKGEFSFGALLKTTVNAIEIGVETTKSYVNEKTKDFKRAMSGSY